jgi:iron complex transport system substrate-binding protein
MKKRLLSLLLAFGLLFALAACNGSTTETPSESPSAATPASVEPSTEPTAEEPATVTFTDSVGREVEVPSNITRIAASGAMAQIVVFSLAPDMLVGIASKWSDSAKQFIDPKYQELPVFGAFYGSEDINLEEVAAQEPQVIIDVGEAKSSIVEDMDGIMEQVGIPTVHIDATTDTMADAYRMLGKLLGMEEEAEVLAKYCETVNSRTHEIADQLGAEGKVNMVYCCGDDGLSVIANSSYHAEVLDLLSNNVAVVNDPSSKGSGNPIDMEQLLNWNPDVIIFAPDSAYDIAGSDSAWQKLGAISSGNYYEAPFGPYNWMGFPPSVNRYMGMVWMAQLLYPEVAGYDMYSETAKFYDLFYHCALTEAQYNELVASSLGK